MKTRILALIAFALPTSISYAQTLKRDGALPAMPLKTEVLNGRWEADIFADYAWTTPEIAGRLIQLSDGPARLPWRGGTVTISKSGDQLTAELSSGATAIVGATIDDKRYYDRQSVQMIAVKNSGTSNDFQYKHTRVPTQETRTVPVYTHNPTTNSTQVSYRQEPYSSYRVESHLVMSPRRNDGGTYETKVEPSKYYVFHLVEGQDFTVYENRGRYYLQNPSYLIAKSAAGVNCIFVDFNANGSFLDPQDRMMWTDQEPKSHHNPSRKDPEGSYWHAIRDLEQFHQLSFSEADNQIHLTNRNAAFTDSKETGTVLFQNVLTNARLFINGEELEHPSKGKPITAEYGEYHYRLWTPGHLDEEGTFLVNASNPNPVVRVRTTGNAATVKFLQPLHGEFTVTTQDAAGNAHTSLSPSDLRLSPGTHDIQMEMNGMIVKRTVTLDEAKVHEMDVQYEFLKLMTLAK